jgi:uncharacterized protein DUF5655/uncharacterized protein DUF1905
MKKQRFTATVFDGHKGAGFEVPFDPAEKWGVAVGKVAAGRRGHNVRGTVNGVRFESVVVPRMRKFFVMVHEEMPVAAGETVEVFLEPIADSVSEHFAGRDPKVRRIYDRVVAAAKKFGPVREEPKKTSIHLARKTAFAGVATRKDALILTIKSDRDLKNKRVTKHERTSANRWYLEVRLTEPSDVDAELKGWLREAYRLES